MNEKEIRINIRYIGGEADEHKLDLYNASTSLLGISKALAISTQAVISQGNDIRVKGAKIPDVQFFLHPPKKGSFIEVISILFEDTAVQALGTSVVVASFWDMLEYSWKIATGQDAIPKTKTVERIIKKNELINDELKAVLEAPLQQVHRPIDDTDLKIQIIRPRTGKVLVLDSSTKNYVYSKNDGGLKENVLGNVTKYNIITGYGRFYSDELEKTVPFNIDKIEMSVEEESLLRWSLYKASVRGGEGKIYLKVQVINDNTKNVKRYIVKGTHTDENNTQVS
ncbi:DUF7946 domain-containing protein [Formosa sp. 3Alg 14/1]|uniref:DUF7946 domain-containing protein n=1 Tax=Formosa sp. 3Alg 14/1 TaxID=3382190 RepID=UPI0039BE056C